MTATPVRPPSPPESRSSSADSFADPSAAIAAVLGLARDLLGVSTALVSRIDGDQWRVTYVDDDAFGFVVGQHLRLQDTICTLIGPDEPILLNDLPSDALAPCYPVPARLGVRAFGPCSMS